jgi:hypothetical protein
MIITLYVSSYIGVFLRCYHRDLVDRRGTVFVYPSGRVLNWKQFGTYFESLEKNGEIVVLNICERIGVPVPVDLLVWVTWRVVVFGVAGEARAC